LSAMLSSAMLLSAMLLARSMYIRCIIQYFQARNSPSILSYAVYIYGSGQFYEMAIDLTSVHCVAG
jgi:hypothetical protein